MNLSWLARFCSLAQYALWADCQGIDRTGLGEGNTHAFLPLANSSEQGLPVPGPFAEDVAGTSSEGQYSRKRPFEACLPLSSQPETNSNDLSSIIEDVDHWRTELSLGAHKRPKIYGLGFHPDKEGAESTRYDLESTAYFDVASRMAHDERYSQLKSSKLDRFGLPIQVELLSQDEIWNSLEQAVTPSRDGAPFLAGFSNNQLPHHETQDDQNVQDVLNKKQTLDDSLGANNLEAEEKKSKSIAHPEDPKLAFDSLPELCMNHTFLQDL
ncbi:hypothetical protein PTTG_11923 [Puccinia triticina 1-1 BBBD Race 1]|uniref:Uncharacterized protein n=1 Tax=Puccinia triticina (isolate 1-1 / race 1 (BBBD)) TaxID=630390 RepID=A0A180GUK3_PUCT1|nr:hypothetical protein PTTG_11923 [Puccinia triticina 1-1 BBBD Race 1]